MFKLIYNPKKEHLSEIESWLIEEWENKNQGFYRNWNIILEAFNNNELIVLTKSDYTIGFLVYQIYEHHSKIDILEIKPSERKKGVGRKLVNETIDYFKSKDVLVVRLFCSPENSELFWKKIGFKNFPNLPHNDNINMFKPLTETLNPIQKAESDYTIRLWNCEPHHKNKVEPKWIWNISFQGDSDRLEKPIIFPASGDWLLELRVYEKIIISNKVKRFSQYFGDYDCFIVIKNITNR